MGGTRSVDITPDKTLVQKLGLTGYSTEQAIAELVDNSIDARLPGRPVSVRVGLDFPGRQILVEDDGAGMGPADLARAMTIARGSKGGGSLGRFGMGMKSACSSLGRAFSVTTSPEGSASEYGAEYDERAWLEDGSRGWSNFEIAERRLTGKDRWHGTRIRVSELSVPLYPNQVSKYKASFGVRYAPYLKSGQASISFNTVSCRPVEPEIAEGSRMDVSIPLDWDNRLVGHVALLKRRSVRGNYGIHLFKNGRLVVPYAKFGFAAHPENSRIIGELSMDHVPARFDKTGFIEEGREYREAERAFREWPAVREAVRRSKSSGRDHPTVGSLLGYFAGGSPPGRLYARMGAAAARKLLGSARAHTATIDGSPVSVAFGAVPGGAPYSVEAAEGGGASITVNRDSPALRYVQNPLFLVGLAVSEARALVRNPGLGAAVAERDSIMARFLGDWSGGEEGDFKDREPPGAMTGFLFPQLVDVHDHLVENYGSKFQFTGLSTLYHRMHTFAGRPIFTLHTVPTRGEFLADMINDEFGRRLAAFWNLDRRAAHAIWDTSGLRTIVAVREYAEIPGPTVAPPEKAWVDLAIEADLHDVLDDLEVRRIYKHLKLHGEIDDARLARYARRMKRTGMIAEIIRAAE